VGDNGEEEFDVDQEDSEEEYGKCQGGGKSCEEDDGEA